ncbi:glycosyltransferase [Seongchinamella sediminis]|uniref:Glycosyltransferase n=1 Tax=Seongchinamella sediminis TaxID=2283635 RepID=A0A3L7DTQ5_9GAMM|nr:glycosyltransferase [Seongchinamella sediminis]RLQ20764.1 glycosyltransferase [Seongchinamella sediminis]
MKPRYLVITELFLPTKGGTAVWFDEVYRRLGDRSTHILTAQVPDCEAHDRDHANTVHRLNLNHSRWLRPASLPIYSKLFFKGLILGMRHRFDAIHAGRVLPEGWVAVLLGRILRLPVVIYAHGEEITTWRRSPRRLKAMTYAYRAAERVVANSDFTRERLLELGVKPERVALINPGVDLERFHPNYETSDLLGSLGLTAEQKLILSVGRLSRRKGFDQVIGSLPDLLAKGLDVHYAIIGIGEDHDYLLDLAGELGVLERVHLLGHVPPDDLPRCYCAADLFAMPNREIDGDTEGFGMVFVEAAACGTPSLAGEAGGTGAAVIHEQTGLRVDGGESEEVTRALARLLDDDGLRLRLAEVAQHRACSELGWDRVAELTQGLASK